MALGEPTTEAGRAGLARVLAAPGRTLLASDFDGVLAPIVADPTRAYAHPDAAAVLGRLAASLAAVAVVTGRPVAEALRLGGFEHADGLSALQVLGQYGVERWDAGTGRLSAPPAHLGVAEVRQAVPGLLADLGLSDVHVEDKGRALGLHVRRLPDPAAALARLRDPVTALAAAHGLVVEPGKQVLELRAPGTDKGTALLALVGDLDADLGVAPGVDPGVDPGADPGVDPSLGVDTVVYAGDDRGDLAAYDAVDRLRAEGRGGVLICVSSAEPTPLEPRADLVLDGPSGMVGWLTDLAEALVRLPR